MVVAGRAARRRRRRRLMVEAGGTEASWPAFEDGAPKVDEDVLAGGLEASKTWIQESIALQQRAHRPRPACKPSRWPTRSPGRLLARGLRRRRGRRRATESLASPAHRRQGRAPRRRGRPARRRSSPSWPRSSPTSPAPRSRSRPPSARSPSRSCASASSTRASASTAVARRDLRPLSAEVGVPPDGARLRPVPAGRDPGAQRRHPGHAPHGPDDRHARHRRPASATCTTTTSRRTPPVRPASCVARSAARSATACSPSGPWCRCCPRQEEFAYTIRLVSEVLSSNGSTSMALGLRLDPVADGRRCADQGAGRRHRHGPRVRRGQVHDPHRHPRRRGRLRRHGLQGRRHRRVRHRPAARHQDRRHPRRRPGRGAAAGQGGPPRRSSRS